MCTVTYIPTKNGVILTSNRDEHENRLPAIAPAKYTESDSTLLYPKDQEKNGSWIAANKNGNMMVLLNGAFFKHQSRPAYGKSRGLLLLKAIASFNPINYFKSTVLNDIEPFTLIIYAEKKLYECRWDGVNKYTLQLNEKLPYIWSSSTLYNEEAKAQKILQFEKWLALKTKKNSNQVFGFHTSQKLDGKISTVSITQIIMKTNHISMVYNDQKSGKTQISTLTIPKPEIPLLGFRIFLVKLFNWEYWPYYLVYGPVMCYWLWLSLRSRSLFFFNTTNPGMRNGGFAMDSKNAIYAHIPQQHCPKTVFVKAGCHVDTKHLQLPLMAKPDIGQRGLAVKLLETAEDLASYAHNSQVDFLLQEYISYPKEAGIFYYRMPGSSLGKITGIVDKELMSVTGDGHSSLQQLLVKNKRYLLQIPALQKLGDQKLQQILPAGETFNPAPYGNHCRGARFIDLSPACTDDLVQHINKVCMQIPGFYYGRLDIKYNSWAELCNGNFMVIEVNGAASEPAHMYDPRHSIFFAWKEIIRHWQILFQISKENRQVHGLSYMSCKEGITLIKNNMQYVKLNTN